MQQLCDEKEPNIPWQIFNSGRILRVRIRRAFLIGTRAILARCTAQIVVVGKLRAIWADKEVRQWEGEKAESHHDDAPAHPFGLRCAHTTAKVGNGNQTEEVGNVVAYMIGREVLEGKESCGKWMWSCVSLLSIKQTLTAGNESRLSRLQSKATFNCRYHNVQESIDD